MKLRKWAYLLEGLMPPAKVILPTGGVILTEDMEEIRLKRVFLTEKDRIRKKMNQEYECIPKFAFYINDGIWDDNLAQRFADAVMSALALIYGPATDDTPKAIGIPEDIIRKDGFIKTKDIVAEGIVSETYFKLWQSVGVPSVVLDHVWRIVPYIVESKSLMDAAHFYKESIGRVWIADDDVFNIMVDNSNIPESQTERARVETAYQNAFKAIEAVIGEPPKDERKLKMKLLGAGINPDEKVGYNLYEMKPGKETILKKVVDMHQNRDKMAAHGKTITPRTIGYCELKDKQALARYILLSHINAINNKSLN